MFHRALARADHVTAFLHGRASASHVKIVFEIFPNRLAAFVVFVVRHAGTSSSFVYQTPLIFVSSDKLFKKLVNKPNALSSSIFDAT
jgi:hypothetical protein